MSASPSDTVNTKVYASAREKCWAAKDAYHDCLRDTGGDRKLCEDQYLNFTSSCPASWVCWLRLDSLHFGLSFSRLTNSIDIFWALKKVKHFEDKRAYRDAPRTGR